MNITLAYILVLYCLKGVKEVLELGSYYTPVSFYTLGGSWYRFVVTGDVTGGRLKTPADADAESLQAKWIGDLAELSLRANDVIPLVDRGRQFAMRRPSDPWYNVQVNI